MKRRLLSVAAALLTLPWLAGCGQQGDGNNGSAKQDPKDKNTPAEIKLAAVSVDDAVKAINAHPGKIVVVDTWASY